MFEYETPLPQREYAQGEAAFLFVLTSGRAASSASDVGQHVACETYFSISLCPHDSEVLAQQCLVIAWGTTRL
jgi:hypothetical protein